MPILFEQVQNPSCTISTFQSNTCCDRGTDFANYRWNSLHYHRYTLQIHFKARANGIVLKFGTAPNLVQVGDRERVLFLSRCVVTTRTYEKFFVGVPYPSIVYIRVNAHAV